MAESVNSKLERVRAPRVHIKYEVETGGAIEMKELPFVMGVLGNLTGHPAISVPCGFTDAGLPVGLQFTGPSYAEQQILQLAHAYEQSTTWHLQRAL